MTITNNDQLINAMANNSSRIIIDKANFANTSIGNYFSYWRILGQPGLGELPTTGVPTSAATAGAIKFTPQTAPATSYFGILEASVGNSGTTIEIHDRLLHSAGLLGNTTAIQPLVNVDLEANLTQVNLTKRIGDPDYSDVQWWLEWYTDTGATASNAQIQVTYNDNTTANLTAVAVGGTVRAGRMIPLNSLVPAAQAGKYIKRINQVQLTASTTGAGSFGITATRYRSSVFNPVAAARITSNYINLGLTEVFNESCLFPVIIANATATNYLKTTGKIIHG